MNELIAVAYGVIQGVTEFIPVSSSGHLALLPKFFSFNDPGVFFDLMMHVGTALAVCLYFKEDIKNLVSNYFNVVVKRSRLDDFSYNFLVTTIISVGFILILKPVSESFGRSPWLIAINLSLFGFILFISDFNKGSRSDLLEKRSLKKSALLGLSQAMAIFPGVSRSGATMTMSRLLGEGREAAGRFSFLLSLPIIFAGALLKTIEVLKTPNIDVNLNATIIGVVVSFFVGLVTIHFFLIFIKKMGLKIFFLYRLILSVLILFYL